jgi:catechol 2,3-dioxygenase
MATRARLGHVAIPAQHPAALAQFYHEVLGLEETVKGSLPNLGDFVFLSDQVDERQQTVAFMTRAEARHVAWEVESLGALQRVYADARAHGATILFALNHHTTVSLYLRDPEGNSVEVYWPIGQEVEGLYAEPIDLALFAQSEAALRAAVGSAVAS